jgi:protoporphyrin/coproporphyrin ferrochelatase
MNKTAVILSNTGTPDDPSVGAVRRYLREFLGDKRVISLPWLPRKILVNGIIAPFRAPRSARLYEKVWTPDGSPLLVYSQLLRSKLRTVLGQNYEVLLGMRYGNPSLVSALEKVREMNFKKVVIIPLYPQYASSTSGSILELVNKRIGSWNTVPSLVSIGQFYDNPGFIDCFSQNILKKEPAKFDHVLFSYHGLPISHVNATHQNMDCNVFSCTGEINETNTFCYRATCYATTRLLADKLNLGPDQYTVCFQSRFSKNWLSPFADEEIVAKAKAGMKKILVVSPSFVTDCLETIIELGYEYRELFLENGGEQLEWVESLNDHDCWVNVLKELVLGELSNY